MSILNNSLLLGAPAGAASYTIERSLRFDSASSSYLSRTPSSAGNRKTWTWAGWVKRGALGVEQYLFDGRSTASTNPHTWISFNASNNLVIGSYSTTTDEISLVTTQVFRDPSAWLHIVVSIDTTQATSSNRVRLYVNGNQVTTFSTALYPTQNLDTYVNATQLHTLGTAAALAAYFSGYLADIHFIDGQALTPSSFGEFDANNVWQPKAYTGTYGTNGFRLDFADNSNNTATTLGKDTSGNGNNLTPTNLSVTAGAGNDSLRDSPSSPAGQTDSGAGGTVVGNYCTWNPIVQPPTSPNVYVYKNGNLDVDFNHAADANGYRPGLGTIAPSSGKWYWEIVWTSGSFARIGVQNATIQSSNFGQDTGGWRYESNTGNIANGSTLTTVSTYAINDVIGIALDCDNGKLYVSKNGTWQNSAVPASGTGAVASNIPVGVPIYPAATTGGFNTSMTANFGQRPFAYTAPSGFKALCTANLPTPTIANGATAMDVKLYTGNGSTQTISGLSFSPDLVWTKSRSAAYNHALWDVVRGVSQRLISNATNAEVNRNGGLTAFNSDGFTHGNDDTGNASSTTYAAWCWDAGSSTVTNTQGSITSQVRANASAGFSIVTYTGNGTANASVGHGLNIALDFVIVKTRSKADGWNCYHRSLGNNKPIVLNSTAAAGTGTEVWGTNAGPTSSVFYVNYPGSFVYTNENGTTYVAYCFAPVAGFSAFGSYTGNGSADGPFVFTGFRPRWLLIKKSSGSDNWILYDTSRSPYNVSNQVISPNSAAAEDTTSTTYTNLDILSNGFKVRASVGGTIGGGGSSSADTYIWAAFAEHPFSLARAR